MSANRLESRMQSMLKQDFRGVAPYLTAGDGGMETTLAVLEALDAGGASCIELGIPFSDPIADGPILQAASQRALDAGTTLFAVLEMLAEFRSRGCTVPVAIMSYANPLYARGWAGAARAVADAGGAVKLVKVDIDENKEIAAQMRIQSIPAVFAFIAGQPVDGFVGAQPESEIKNFIGRVVEKAGGSIGPTPLESAMEQARAAEDTGDIATAGAIYAEIVKHEPGNLPAIAGMARALLRSQPSSFPAA